MIQKRGVIFIFYKVGIFRVFSGFILASIYHIEKTLWAANPKHTKCRSLG